MSIVDDIYEYGINAFYGVPYRWGGTGPPKDWGVDCSGLVQRLLARGKIDPPGDQTADGLYRHFLKNYGLRNTRGRGALAFYGTESRIVHVGWCIDKVIMLEAGGGGSHVTTLEKAARAHAAVRIAPIDRRIDLVDVVMPNYP